MALHLESKIDALTNIGIRADERFAAFQQEMHEAAKRHDAKMAEFRKEREEAERRHDTRVVELRQEREAAEKQRDAEMAEFRAAMAELARAVAGAHQRLDGLEGNGQC